MESLQLLGYAQRLQALAQAGITYAANGYDLERFEEIRDISARLLAELTDEPFEKIIRVFASDEGYQTPKIDIRAVIFRGTDQILMVREKIDNDRWTLPGGWADIGYSPYEVAVKEAREETGLIVQPSRLLGVVDRSKFSHPPSPGYAYKIFIECMPVGGTLSLETSETSGGQWFRLEDALKADLSTGRITTEQLKMVFEYAGSPQKEAFCN